MMIAWYQPTEVMNQKRLIHLCENDAKITLCGKEINQNWIALNRTLKHEITCSKCLKKKDIKG